MGDEEVLRRQFAEEVIRFVHERVAPERRKRVAWVFAVLDVDDPIPFIVSTFDSSGAAADMLEHLATRLRGAKVALLKAAPGAS